MKPPNWDRLQEIYHLALARPRSERDAFISEACAGDPALLRQVQSLLKAHDSSDFLNIPVSRLGSATGDLVGTTVDGRYDVEKKLSPGGMSQVYLAHDKKFNGQAVVIKVLSQELVHHPYLRKKFEHEVEALRRFKHPSVVHVQDRGELNGRPYIVMEYVDGETLRSQIPTEGMRLERAASILKQIGEALDHVHGKGIFHRDLKPENIMLKRGSDEVVLIDFGIAKVTDPIMAPNTTHGPPIGTLLYMSPEQLQDEEVMAASDIYSMAVISYEMLDGRRPFTATSAPELLKMQKAGVDLNSILRRRNISLKVRDAIARGLSFKPNKRYKRASEFGNELEAALNEKQPGGKRWLISQPVRRRVALGALSVLISTVGLYIFLKSCNGPPPSNSFTYFLTVQRMQDGKEYKEPFRSNGEQIFDNGDKFQLTVLSPKPAYVYVINEGPPEANDTNVTMIYPNRTTNNGSATLGANQSFQSDWIPFRGPAGDDNFWMVWSTSPVNELETAKNEAFNHPRGGLSDRTWVAMKQFLQMKQSEADVTVFHYKKTQEAMPRGKGDLLVTLAQFKHR
jgi:serine/threonine protein kinase